MSRLPVAVIGSGNIGTDLVVKLRRSTTLEPVALIGIDLASDGLRHARQWGLEASSEGIEWLLANADRLGVRIVYEATSAAIHATNAPRFAERGLVAIDLTPAAVGPTVVPPVNLMAHLDAPNLNMITCGGQATIPMVAAVSAVMPVPYAEIVSTVASRSAGPGTRANIDEFTETTSHAIEVVGGAERGKAIIILNPVEPPMIMRDTVFCSIPPECDRDAIAESIFAMVEKVQTYVPGYTLRADPQFDDPREIWNGHARVAVFLEVLGAGDYLPTYAGNLDIITAAAAEVGDMMAKAKVGVNA